MGGGGHCKGYRHGQWVAAAAARLLRGVFSCAEVEPSRARAGAPRWHLLLPPSLRPACPRDIRAVLEGPPAQLLEAVAERAAARVLGAHPRVTAVRLRIRKPHVAVGGVVESLGVEVVRQRAPAAIGGCLRQQQQQQQQRVDR